jgi:2-keto-myo-inositol isomerase
MMQTLIGLNPLTIKQCTDFEKKIEIAAKAGYQGIGLRGNEIEDYLKGGHTLADVIQLLDEYGLAVTDIGSVAGWQFSGHPPLVCRLKSDGQESHEELTAKLHTFFKNASQVGCKIVPAIAAIEEEGDFDKGVEDFAAVCDQADAYGLNIALEFIGFGKQMNTLNVAHRVIEQAGRKNGGILFDTFHFYRGNCKIEDIDPVPIEKILLVHVNDVMDLPRETVTDIDRLYPGLGVVDLENILGALMDKGYSGFYSLEIFNNDYWAADPLQVALQAKAHTEKIFQSISTKEDRHGR